jgi:hypothetical protein
MIRRIKTSPAQDVFLREIRRNAAKLVFRGATGVAFHAQFTAIDCISCTSWKKKRI